MSSAPEWFPWAFGAACFISGWLMGALWHSKRHLADIRAHIRWIEQYTTSVNDLLEDFAEALPKGGEG